MYRVGGPGYGHVPHHSPSAAVISAPSSSQMFPPPSPQQQEHPSPKSTIHAKLSPAQIFVNDQPVPTAHEHIEDRKPNLLSAMQQFMYKNPPNHHSNLQVRAGPSSSTATGPSSSPSANDVGFHNFSVPYPPRSSASPSGGHHSQPLSGPPPVSMVTVGGVPQFAINYSLPSKVEPGLRSIAVTGSTSVPPQPSSSNVPLNGGKPRKMEKPSSSGLPGTSVFFGVSGGVRTMVWSPPPQYLPGNPAAVPGQSFGSAPPDTTRRSLEDHDIQAVKGLVELGQAAAAAAGSSSSSGSSSPHHQIYQAGAGLPPSNLLPPPPPPSGRGYFAGSPSAAFNRANYIPGQHHQQQQQPQTQPQAGSPMQFPAEMMAVAQRMIKHENGQQHHSSSLPPQQVRLPHMPQQFRAGQ